MRKEFLAIVGNQIAMDANVLACALACELSRVIQQDTTDTWTVVQEEVNTVLDTFSPLRERVQQLRENIERFKTCAKRARQELVSAIDTGLVDRLEGHSVAAEVVDEPWREMTRETLAELRELLEGVVHRLESGSCSSARKMPV